MVNKSLLSMPIDQYGRYRIVSQLLKTLGGTDKTIKILDVGGYRGSLHKFLDSKTEITVLDIYDVKDENYVKGDAMNLPFEDNSFDFVVSFEVFEHIKREDREKFISEALRVSKGPFILSAPFAGSKGEIAYAEKAVNSLWQQIHHQDHPWLKEHIEYRIPDGSELEKIIKKNKAQFVKYGNNDVMLWALMQSLTFFGTTYKENADRDDIQTFYNENADTLESNALSYYRYVYLITRNPSDLSKLGAAMYTDVSPADKAQVTAELVTRIFKAVQAEIQDIITDKNQQINEAQKSAAKHSAETQKLSNQLHEFKAETEYLRTLLEEIQSSKAWKVSRKIGAAKHRARHPIKKKT